MLIQLLTTNKGLTTVNDSPTRKYVKQSAKVSREYSQKMTANQYKIFCDSLTIENANLIEEDEGSEVDTWSQYKTGN